MRELLIDNNTKHIDSLKALLPSADVIPNSDIHAQLLSSYSAIILSGSQKHGVIKHADLFADQVNLIRQSSTPLLGICFGFELMVHAYGGTLRKMEHKIQEIHHVTITEEKDPIFEGISELVVYKGHRWVVDTLPHEFIPLAHSNTGIEVIRHKDRLLYGVQFHPEAYPESTTGSRILQNFLKMAEGAFVNNLII